MKKKIFGRQLSRDTHERTALFKGLINALVMQESITTTQAKAKSIRGEIEKLITKAKRKGPAAKSLLQPWLQKEALEKMMSDLAVRFAKRPGGYTRIITLGERFGDNATMAIIEFVEKGSAKQNIDAEKVMQKPATTKSSSEGKVQKNLPKQSQNPKSPKKTTKRPPSKAEMEKRKAGE